MDAEVSMQIEGKTEDTSVCKFNPVSRGSNTVKLSLPGDGLVSAIDKLWRDRATSTLILWGRENSGKSTFVDKCLLAGTYRCTVHTTELNVAVERAKNGKCCVVEQNSDPLQDPTFGPYIAAHPERFVIINTDNYCLTKLTAVLVYIPATHKSSQSTKLGVAAVVETTKADGNYVSAWVLEKMRFLCLERQPLKSADDLIFGEPVLLSSTVPTAYVTLPYVEDLWYRFARNFMRPLHAKVDWTAGGWKRVLKQTDAAPSQE